MKTKITATAALLASLSFLAISAPAHADYHGVNCQAMYDGCMKQADQKPAGPMRDQAETNCYDAKGKCLQQNTNQRFGVLDTSNDTLATLVTAIPLQ